MVPECPHQFRTTRTGLARHDLVGFGAVLVAVAVGVALSDRFGPPVAQALLGPLLEGGTMPPALQRRWVELLAQIVAAHASQSAQAARAAAAPR